MFNRLYGEVLDKVLKILNVNFSDILNIEKLGGLTNDNYKISFVNEEFVVRLPGKTTKEFINRINEKENCKIAGLLGLDSECVYFDETSGVKVSKFIKNAQTLNSTISKEITNIELMCNNLKILHNSNQKFNNIFDPFTTIKIYEDALITINGKISNDYYELKRIFTKFQCILNKLDIEYTPCHIDPLPENFIKSNQGKLYLIDWEYSGNYDPLWDLAAVILECNFSKEQENILLNKYLGRSPNNYEKTRIYIHKIMQDIFWSLWAATKVAKGETHMIDFCKSKYNNARKNIKEYIMMEKNIYEAI